MITEKPRFFFSFLACESCIVQPAVVALAKKVYLVVFVVKCLKNRKEKKRKEKKRKEKKRKEKKRKEKKRKEADFAYT